MMFPKSYDYIAPCSVSFEVDFTKHLFVPMLEYRLHSSPSFTLPSHCN